MGLFICDHSTSSPNPYNEYAEHYNNICASGSKTSWRYNYYNYDDFPTLYIIPRDEDKDHYTDINCDIFAYIPYQEGVTTPEEVPFSIPGQTDIMYAEENADPGINKNIDPAAAIYTDPSDSGYSDGKIHASLTFHHALSLLEFDIKLKNNTYNHPWGHYGDEYTSNTIKHELHSVTIDKMRAGAKLYASGKMNAIDGTLYGLVDANSVTAGKLGHNNYYYDIAVPPYETAKAYMVIVPTQAGDPAYVDDDYRFTFNFSNQTFPITFSLKKAHLKHSDDTYGFKTGYKYTFKFTIDNYIHLDDIQIGEWSPADTPFQKEI